jgi:hypothetical protein
MSKQHRRTLDESRHPFDLPPGRERAVERPRSRVYQGEEAGTRVTRWLNGHDDTYRGLKKQVNKPSAASRRRISDLLKNLRDVLELVEKVDPQFDWMENPHPQLDTIGLELQKRLAEYPTAPFFYPTYGREWVIEDAVVGDRPAGESVAAHSIILLAQQGLLDRIDLCDCGKWYFARFRHQRCCSALCRRKFYEKTDEFREKRRKYMRKYYRLKNSGKVK